MLHLSSQLRCHIIVPSCVSYSNVWHILSMELVVRYSSSLVNGDSADLFKSQSFVPWNLLVNNCKFLLLVRGCLWAWDQLVFGGRRLTLDGKNKTRISTRCQMVQQVQQSIVCIYRVQEGCCGELLWPDQTNRPKSPSSNFFLFII